MVVFLFNILDPDGVDDCSRAAGDVSLGAVTAVFVGLLLWPRGARAALARSVAKVYRVAAEGVGVGVSGYRRRPAERRRPASRRRSAGECRLRRRARRARRAHRRDRMETLSRPPAEAHAILCGLMPALPAPTPSGCNAAVETVNRQAAAVSGELAAVADQLEIGGKERATDPISGPDGTAGGLPSRLGARRRSRGRQGARRPVVGSLAGAARRGRSPKPAMPAPSWPALASPRAWLRWSLQADIGVTLRGRPAPMRASEALSSAPKIMISATRYMKKMAVTTLARPA